MKQRGLMWPWAVFGNIVTSWSWFGVNMLGVGLHSYGFMESTFWWLIAFVISQLAFIALANLPLEKWPELPNQERLTVFGLVSPWHARRWWTKSGQERPESQDLPPCFPEGSIKDFLLLAGEHRPDLRINDATDFIPLRHFFPDRDFPSDFRSDQ